MKNLYLLFCLIYFVSCTTKTTTEGDQQQTIKLTKAPASTAYPDASIALQSLDITKGDSLHKLDFTFDVQNFELGAQTADAATRGIANSPHGQHIHFIVNNGPYEAHYPASFSYQPSDGSYVLLAFLSRSYHESVKEATAFWIDTVTLGEAVPLNVDLTAPHMFYSRPKGAYTGEGETKKLMLDFYLLNTTLSADGNKVKATINGQEFIIDEWAPYYIEGLPLGEVTVSLELIDKDGNLVPGPFNQVTRKVTLKE